MATAARPAETATVVDVTKQDGLDEVRVDDGTGDVLTAEHFAPSGVDAPPLPGDAASVIDARGQGARHVAGYADPVNEGVAEPGEFRAYARKADGTPVCEVWCKADGSILVRSLMTNAPVRVEADTVNVISPDVNLGEAGGRPLARVGDLVAVTVPLLTVTVPGSPPTIVPAIPANGAQMTSTGYIAAGQIISGSTRAKAGG